MAKVTFRGTKAQLLALLRQLPAVLAGKAPDPWGIVQGLQLRLGVALLSKIQQAFIVKSRGGTGDDGITWPPLKRSTISQRRLGPGEKKALGIGGRRLRGLLTPAQDKRWRQVYGSRLASLLVNNPMPLPEAKARAAQIAWAVVKGEGARTKLDVLGNRQVDMLRDTGELFRSLTPGVADRPSGADGQVFQVPAGQVIVGTNKKPWHHDGVPGRLPARKLWPDVLPDAWWNALLGVYLRGLETALARVLRGP